MIEPRELVSLGHLGYFSNILRDKGEILKSCHLENFIDASQKHFCKMPREDYGVMFSLGSRVHLVKSKNTFQI